MRAFVILILLITNSAFCATALNVDPADDSDSDVSATDSPSSRNSSAYSPSYGTTYLNKLPEKPVKKAWYKKFPSLLNRSREAKKKNSETFTFDIEPVRELTPVISDEGSESRDTGPGPDETPRLKRLCYPKIDHPVLSITVNKSILPEMAQRTLDKVAPFMDELLRSQMNRVKIPLKMAGLSLNPVFDVLKVGKIELAEVPEEELQIPNTVEYEATVPINDVQLRLAAEARAGWLGWGLKQVWGGKYTDQLALKLRKDPNRPTQIKFRFAFGEDGKIFTIRKQENSSIPKVDLENLDFDINSELPETLILPRVSAKAVFKTPGPPAFPRTFTVGTADSPPPGSRSGPSSEKEDLNSPLITQGSKESESGESSDAIDRASDGASIADRGVNGNADGKSDGKTQGPIAKLDPTDPKNKVIKGPGVIGALRGFVSAVGKAILPDVIEHVQDTNLFFLRTHVENMALHFLSPVEKMINKKLNSLEVNPDEIGNFRAQALLNISRANERARGLTARALEAQKALTAIYQDAKNPKKLSLFDRAKQFFKKSKVNEVKEIIKDFRKLAEEQIEIANDTKSPKMVANLDRISQNIEFFKSMVTSIQRENIDGVISEDKINILENEVNSLDDISKNIQKTAEDTDKFIKEAQLKSTVSVIASKVEGAHLLLNMFLGGKQAGSEKRVFHPDPAGSPPLPEQTKVRVTISPDGFNEVSHQFFNAGGYTCRVGDKTGTFQSAPEIGWEPDPTDPSHKKGRHFVRFGNINLSSTGTAQHFLPETVKIPEIFFEFAPCKDGIARVCMKVDPVSGANLLTRTMVDRSMEEVRLLLLKRMRVMDLPKMMSDLQEEDPGFLNPYRIEHVDGKIEVHLN